MSTTDEARLDALDQRGRAAARTLLDDLAARDARTLVVADATAPAAPSAPVRVQVGRLTRRGGGRSPRRRLLAAAVVVVLATMAGVTAFETRDDGADVQSGGPLDYLLPGWLPAGLDAAHAVDVPDAAALGFGTDIAIYGDPDADDPWSATVAVTHLAADEELLGDLPPDGEAVTVGGHEARLTEAESEDIWADGPDGHGWQVVWTVDDGRLMVTGSLTRDEVLAAAEAATTEPAIDGSGLPDGYEELARGPLLDRLLFTSLFEGTVDSGILGSADGAGLAVAYADPSDRDAVRTAIVVAQRPGPASAVDLLRLAFPDAEATTVRGRHAMVGRGDELPGSAGESGVVAVQWAESEGQLVTVVGFGVPESAVLQVAGDMRPAAPGEVAALREEHAVAAPREFGDVPAGHVVAASGASDTGQWRIVADARGEANVGRLTIERIWGAIGSTSSTTGDRVEPPLDLGADFSDGVAVVWGVLWPEDATSVTVEAPGVEPVSLGIHEVEGWSRRVVAGSFPMDHFARASDVVVVARDADRRQIGRNSTVLGTDG